MRGIKRKKETMLAGEENICLLKKGATVRGTFYPAGTKLSCDRHDALQLVKSRSCDILEMKWPQGAELHEFGAPIPNQFDER